MALKGLLAMSDARTINETLSELGLTPYATPIDEENRKVFLCRLNPMTDADVRLTMAEARLLQFIEKALNIAKSESDWKVRFSRPWVLKQDKLAFTWDFTFMGDLDKAANALGKISIGKPPAPREEEAPIHTVKNKRGRVRQVSVGAIR